MRAAFVLPLLLLLVGRARANEDPDTEVARRHFNAGRAYYDSAEYERALDEFRQARRARAHPALDYNIARCLDRLERYPDAILSYQLYAATNPPDASEIRTRILELKDRIEHAPPKPPEPPVLLPPAVSLSQTPAPPPARKSQRTVAIVLGVLGGAIVIGAAVAIGLLVKTTTAPATPDSTGGPHPATQ